MARELEPWGGEVRLPGWMRRLLRRPDPAAPTAEAAEEARQAAHEARKAHPTVSVGKNADRAAFGPLTEMYHEGRKKPRRKQD
jgi:hypothetical protein